jgi:hypothetical protein
MKSQLITPRHSKRKSHAVRPAVMTLEARLVPATFVATQFADGISTGTLRWAILQADQTPGSNTVVLRPGTYTLTRIAGTGIPGQTGALQVQGDVTIKGAGPTRTQVVANALGDHVFHVTGGNVIFSGLTISGGSAAQGGGVLIDSGNIKITHCVLASNVAAGAPGGSGEGGALYQAAGSLLVTNTAVSGNLALGSDAPSGSAALGGPGAGGGFFLGDKVTAQLVQDGFSNNSAQGGKSSTLSGSAGGFGAGGAIRGVNVSLSISQSSFTNNRATGGAGVDATNAPPGGEAIGGAIAVQTDATLVLTHSAFSGNQAIGGIGGNGSAGGDGGDGLGGAIYGAFGSTISANADSIAGNAAIGGNAGTGGINPPPSTQHTGGAGFGGGIYCFIGTSATLTKSAVMNNVAQGGRGGDGTYGGDGGQGGGGGFWSAAENGNAQSFTARQDLFTADQSVGGNQGAGTTANGAGGPALGGAVYLGSAVTATLRNTKLDNDRAIGVSIAKGGALYGLFASVDLSFDNFSGDIAAGGPGSFAAGGAIYADQHSTLTAMCVTLLANQATGGNGVGSFSGGFGQGGAIVVSGAQASVRESTFKFNAASGGEAGTGSAGGGQGGAIDTMFGTLSVTGSLFDANQAKGGAQGAGSSGGSGQGGGLFNNPASSLAITNSTIERNSALGATGFGGGIYLTGSGQGTVTKVKFSGNAATTSGPDIFGPT